MPKYKVFLSNPEVQYQSFIFRMLGEVKLSFQNWGMVKTLSGICSAIYWFSLTWEYSFTIDGRMLTVIPTSANPWTVHGPHPPWSKKIHIGLYSALQAVPPYPQVSILGFNYWNQRGYKWTHVVQTCVVLGSRLLLGRHFAIISRQMRWVCLTFTEPYPSRHTSLLSFNNLINERAMMISRWSTLRSCCKEQIEKSMWLYSKSHTLMHISSREEGHL